MKRSLLFALALCLSLAPLPALAIDLDAIEARLADSEGESQWLREDVLDRTRVELDAALAERPNSARVLSLRGVVNLRLGNYRSARADFEQALRAQPRNALAHYNLALTLEKLGQWSDARSAYEQAVLADPEFAPAQYNLGRVYENAKDYKRAESAYYAAWLSAPESTRILNSLGNIRFKQGDYRGAMIYYDEAKSTAPTSGLIHHNRALTLETLQRYEEALQVYLESLEAAPDWNQPRLGFARCAWRLNIWDDIEKTLAPVLESSDKTDVAQARVLIEALRSEREGRAPATPVKDAIKTPEEPADQVPEEKKK